MTLGLLLSIVLCKYPFPPTQASELTPKNTIIVRTKPKIENHRHQRPLGNIPPFRLQKNLISSPKKS
eukprot:TRINITY_DN5203_c0_g1_i1.p1 TRINITY_DN5203_c0_g1~~TRINITY_DN5203_c0_g1_i1.p1  ORF type:complete len:67 (+),score=3.17 TRINITY_DN5203_c0_g1_i1:472-672(+)